jgi:hypothetical protein
MQQLNAVTVEVTGAVFGSHQVTFVIEDKRTSALCPMRKHCLMQAETLSDVELKPVISIPNVQVRQWRFIIYSLFADIFEHIEVWPYMELTVLLQRRILPEGFIAYLCRCGFKVVRCYYHGRDKPWQVNALAGLEWNLAYVAAHSF